MIRPGEGPRRPRLRKASSYSAKHRSRATMMLRPSQHHETPLYRRYVALSLADTGNTTSRADPSPAKRRSWARVRAEIYSKRFSAGVSRGLGDRPTLRHSHTPAEDGRGLLLSALTSVAPKGKPYPLALQNLFRVGRHLVNSADHRTLRDSLLRRVAVGTQIKGTSESARMEQGDCTDQGENQ